MCDVVVLDDDVVLLDELARSLRAIGLEVVQAGRSSDALACFDRDDAPRLLVTDVDLGETRDGCEVARLARKASPLLPVIFITGRPDRFCAASLADNEWVLAKPFRFSALIAAVRQAGRAAKTFTARPPCPEAAPPPG